VEQEQELEQKLKRELEQEQTLPRRPVWKQRVSYAGIIDSNGAE